MRWDKKGAIKALDTGECFVCKEVKPVYVVVTLHGKKDLHIPCCSNECAAVVAEVATEVQTGR
ncbi:hypothetical protein WMO40_24165 [Bacillaceae bacterium CLA-AA-H227]|uniref:Uncharacterized protein n=1 Tax=Robertmurraya yapensis (ex Hitch et al 2024) TaxID=3133160 RepID=A0ACC6SIS6_9BACI